MNLYSKKDDLLMGNDSKTGSNGKTVIFSTPGNGTTNGDDLITQELMKIVAIHKKHDLTQHPEVLAGMLDDLKAKIKAGNILDILRDPIVYGSISVVLLLVIIMKMQSKKRR